MGAETQLKGSLFYTGVLILLPVAVGTYLTLGDLIATGNPVLVLFLAPLALLLAGTTVAAMLGATGLDK